jgi:hypothetical protein
VRQLFIEGLTLGAIGGVAGVALAWAALSLLVQLAPPNVPRLSDATLDSGVLVFALALTAGTSLIFGVLSVGRILDFRPWRTLGGKTSETRLTGHSVPHRRRLNVLAIAELALTMVLLVAAGTAAAFVRRAGDGRSGLRRTWRCCIAGESAGVPVSHARCATGVRSTTPRTTETNFRRFGAGTDDDAADPTGDRPLRVQLVGKHSFSGGSAIDAGD